MEQGNQNTLVAEKIKKYVKAHLQEPITASDIAKAAGYSQYHTTRLFKAETGESPFEYIRRERLTQSAHALRQGKPRVIDVALDYVLTAMRDSQGLFQTLSGLRRKSMPLIKNPKVG